MKKFTWLMFIMGKMKILNGREDITELAFLLFATIYWAIMLCPKDVTCELIESKSFKPAFIRFFYPYRL